MSNEEILEDCGSREAKYIYRITCSINSKVYIGQTNNPSLRWIQHKSLAKCEELPTTVVSRAIKKYGYENFIFKVIATCLNPDYANEVETKIIQQYDACNHKIGYNIDIGGGCLPRSKETCVKVSKALKKFYANNVSPLKGRKYTEQHKNNISAGSMGKPGTNVGKTFDEEWKLKMSKSQTGKGHPSLRRFTGEQEVEICRLYIDEKISTYKLGQMYDCFRNVIRNVLVRNNIEIRSNNRDNGRNIFTKEQEIEIVNEYLENKLSMRALGFKYKCDGNTIRAILIRNKSTENI